MRRQCWALAVVILAGALVGMTTSSAAPAAHGQRIAIDKQLVPPGDHGSFRLTAITGGAIGTDSGTWTYVETRSSKGVRDGQGFTRNLGTSTFSSSRGTIVFREDETVVDITVNLRAIGAGVWSLVRGSGAYKGLSGNGRMAGWYTPTGSNFERYEGYLRAGGGS